MIKKLTTIIFVFCAFTFVNFAQVDNRTGLTWQVLKYDITATLPNSDADRNLTAKAVLNLKNTTSSSAAKLTLRISEKAEITSVKANGTTADFSKGVPEKIDGNRNLQRVSVSLPSVAANGTVSVEVNYKLTVTENNGLNALSPTGSQCLPLSFWYPTPTSWYFSGNADYAPFKIQVNGAEQVVSSGVSSSNSFDQKLNGQPFFVTGSWDLVNYGGVEVLIPKGSDAEAQKRANELAALANDAKTFTANLLGNAPDVPLRIVSSKRSAGFSGGGTVFVDDAVFRQSKIDSATALTIAEAVTKIWLGNSVQIYGDGYGVVREGLTRYIATLFLESKYGKEIADVERLRQRTAYAAISQRDAPLNIVSPIDDFYYTEVSNKGAMIWRLLAKKVGQNEFFSTVRRESEDKNLSLNELRNAFSSDKDFNDYAFNQVTDTNLLVGLPVVNGTETKVALRNTGSIDAFVDVSALTASGEKLTANVVLKAKSFGEVTFKNAAKIVRVEIDPDKFYPQTDYSEDVAPRELTDSDFYLAIKKILDKQEFANAEKAARIVLRDFPRFDDVRILLARSLLAQNKLGDAEREFKNVLDEKLPTSRSLAWANVGLGEVAAKSGKSSDAVKYFGQAILAESDSGASFAARTGRNKINSSPSVDDSIKTFFTQFDKSAILNSKAQLTALIVPGEVTRFANGLVGQTEKWATTVLQVDKVDANTVLVETKLNIKLLSRSDESGTAVYRLTKISGGWKLSGVESFEVN